MLETSESSDAAQPPPVDYRSPVEPQQPSIQNTPVGRLDVAIILIRCLAILCGMWAMAIVTFIPLLVEPRVGDLFYRLRLVAPYVLELGAGILLWLSARWLAVRMLHDVAPTSDVTVIAEPAPPRDVPAANGSELHAMAISLVGLIIAVYALRNLPLIVTDLPSFQGVASPNRWYLIQFALETGSGAILFFKARSISQLWYRSSDDASSSTLPTE